MPEDCTSVTSISSDWVFNAVLKQCVQNPKMPLLYIYRRKIFVYWIRPKWVKKICLFERFKNINQWQKTTGSVKMPINELLKKKIQGLFPLAKKKAVFLIKFLVHFVTKVSLYFWNLQKKKKKKNFYAYMATYSTKVLW
jgi:hypothetical protein